MSGQIPKNMSPMSGNPADLAVTFWGVRGSAPVSGPEYLAFGGGTMCLEVLGGGRRIILDAGSGISKLGWLLNHKGIQQIDILLTHFHMDHIIGLMSFSPLFQKGARVTVHAPVLDTGEPEEILSRLFAKPFFPVAPGDMGAAFVVRGFRPGARLAIAGFDVRTMRLSHPGGSCGYRIGHEGRSLAVVADHEHQSDMPEDSLAEFCAGADLVLYDAPWDETTDYGQRRGWGHSTWQAGLRLLRASEARRLGCIHHAPESTDDLLIKREASLRRRHRLGFFAREGETMIIQAPVSDQPSSASARSQA